MAAAESASFEAGVRLRQKLQASGGFDPSAPPPKVSALDDIPEVPVVPTPRAASSSKPVTEFVGQTPKKPASASLTIVVSKEPSDDVPSRVQAAPDPQADAGAASESHHADPARVGRGS
ncbi:hypothetical protein FNF29_04457 [Cafeteria roenbergensis]|uniref:Uncharacterized protein n=1 Tax=Cafeteria roenbergensis TaxID=33653 RepID=A0A5A8CEJ2_CAFRO|nr:hypothetical protein FNF29_04457 [Cafeteria roenbergensis]|eukprot:KAA0151533.1 hypothetical protein FNF29_04457 [Cafeteria roenbergensis]